MLDGQPQKRRSRPDRNGTAEQRAAATEALDQLKRKTDTFDRFLPDGELKDGQDRISTTNERKNGTFWQGEPTPTKRLTRKQQISEFRKERGLKGQSDAEVVEAMRREARLEMEAVRRTRQQTEQRATRELEERRSARRRNQRGVKPQRRSESNRVNITGDVIVPPGSAPTKRQDVRRNSGDAERLKRARRRKR